MDNSIPLGNGVQMNISAIVSLADASGYHNLSFECSGEWETVYSVEVEDISDGWLEIDLTKLFIDIWDLISTNDFIEVGLKFDLDSCESHIPLRIVNPGTTDYVMEQVKREREWKKQPFLVIFVDEVEATGSHKKEKYTLPKNAHSSDMERDEGVRRKRRGSSNISCRTEDYHIVFHDIHIEHVLLPRSLNIRQCVGSCEYNVLQLMPSIASTHAQLMSSSTEILQNQTGNNARPTTPCCSAAEYSEVYHVNERKNMSTPPITHTPFSPSFSILYNIMIIPKFY